ncbi:MAG: DNA translocase FtsK 4TM domain-containing protein [Desulfohalobiaceae bacterium]|nr:DNA translocase FtsK 4TM domain-containing protein [Desulfohalobiaceae bacterium]
MGSVDGNKIVRELCALGLFFSFVLVSLSLASYSPADPTLPAQVGTGQEARNLIGIVGAYLAGLVVGLFGLGAWVVPLMMAAAGACVLWPDLRPVWYRWLGLFFLFLCLVTWGSSSWPGHTFSVHGVHGGGLVGDLCYWMGERFLQSWGTFLFWLFLLLGGLQLVLRLSWKRLGEILYHGSLECFSFFKTILRRLLEKADSYRNRPAAETHSDEAEATPPPTSRKPKGGKQKASAAQPQSPRQQTATIENSPKKRSFPDQAYPPLELFQDIRFADTGGDGEDLQHLTEKLSACLVDFGVQGEVINVIPGPVVTMFEFRPAPGVKISRIANLNDDLALALKAIAVRIEAPIPGRDLVGIEIPNKFRKTVHFKEIIASKAFQKPAQGLWMALGSDIQGEPVVEELGRMPHLLVAGATGAGKSVCLNSILISLLCKSNPQELQLLLVDPKRIEMGLYADLPHLVHPVVTEMELAKAALDWAVHEMDRRYEILAEMSVRNIQGYNKKVSELRNKQPSDTPEPEPLPYLVIIIDELADLILTVGKEAEASIIRLGQLARAAGIHLILATQRPSVDVVTGLIKANFPSRIAFQVSSKHDSRTILDTVGAQYLLGMGDMLFKSSAGRLRRIHGAYIDDADIGAVIDFWKEKQTFQEKLDLSAWKRKTGGSGPDSQGEDVLDDPLYDQAVEFVQDQGKASISMIQRQLRIGFNRAARFIEQMEQDGIIGPQEGSKPRTVVKH